MGTNYYLKTDVCAHCGRGDERKHIGKSSMGWTFMLHVDPENGINDLPDWERLWSEPGAKIEDEYGRDVAVHDMRHIIVERRGKVGTKTPEFYRDIEDMLQKNQAILMREWGLLRANKDAKYSHCIGYGDGPWDLITGEFS